MRGQRALRDGAVGDGGSRGQITLDTVGHGKAGGYFIKRAMGHGTKQGHVFGVRSRTRCVLLDLGGTLEPPGDPS
mgnify:CR=1 FL=1